MAIKGFSLHPYDPKNLVIVVDGVKQFGRSAEEGAIRFEKVKGKNKLYLSMQANSPTISGVVRKDSQNLSMQVCLMYETSGEGYLDTNLGEYLGDVFTAKSTSQLDFLSGYPIIHFVFTEI